MAQLKMKEAKARFESLTVKQGAGLLAFCFSIALGGAFLFNCVKSAASKARGMPADILEVRTANHLRSELSSLLSDGVVNAHGHLREAVQWENYPFSEERVDGLSRAVQLKVPDLQLDQFYQEFVEESTEVLGSGLPGLLKVVQHSDPAFSKKMPPIGPFVGKGWGGTKRFPYPSYHEGNGYKMERVETSQEGVQFALYRQGETQPFFKCSSHPCAYTFVGEDRGKWYQVAAFKAVAEGGPPTEELRRVYVGFPMACGSGYFSQKSLTCDARPEAAAPTLAKIQDLLETTPDLPFGLELESAARAPYTPEEQARKLEAATKYFGGNRTNKTFSTLQKENFKGSSYKDNFKAVQSCFNKVTSGLFKEWRWEEEENTFLPSEISKPDEMLAVPFEFTAPNPPRLTGAAGVKKMVAAVAGLAAAGLQSGPRQSFDIHLMLREKPENSWTDRDIAFFFAGYVRAQYAVDSMTLTHHFGGEGLYLWDPKMQYVFRNLHRLLSSLKHPDKVSDPKLLCDAILGKGECDSDSAFWPSKHTPFRHYAINFAKIFSFKSLELRGSRATNDPEVAARWVDVTLRMANQFKADGSLQTFFDEDVETDLKQLHAAQEKYSLQQLFTALELPASSRDFYLQRRWAKTGSDGAWGANCVDDLVGGDGDKGKLVEGDVAKNNAEAAKAESALLERLGSLPKVGLQAGSWKRRKVGRHSELRFGVEPPQ